VAGSCEHINDPSDSVTREGGGGGRGGDFWIADEFLVVNVGISFMELFG